MEVNLEKDNFQFKNSIENNSKNNTYKMILIWFLVALSSAFYINTNIKDVEIENNKKNRYALKLEEYNEYLKNEKLKSIENLYNIKKLEDYKRLKENKKAVVKNNFNLYSIYPIEELKSNLNSNKYNLSDSEINNNGLKIKNKTHIYAINSNKTNDFKKRIKEYIIENYNLQENNVENINIIVDTVFKVSQEKKFDPFLILSIISIESTYNLTAKSNAGAKGLMQIIPKYHNDILKENKIEKENEIFLIEKNINVGTDIIKNYINLSNNINNGLQRYNGSLNDENKKYSKKVLNKYEKYKKIALNEQ